MLKIVIGEKKDVQTIFDNIKLIDIYNRYMSLLPIICSKLPDLHGNHYHSLVMKYILCTSILLDPSCSSVKNLTDTSFRTYSKDVYIKESIPIPLIKKYFKRFFSSFLSFDNKHLRLQEEAPTISLIVPFFQICKYHGK